MAKRGRPATFDRSEVLDRAMEVFWARGYEGTTLEDLQAAMGGISPPSFYNAFGSKEALFREAVERYITTVGAPAAQALAGEGTAREAIEGMLRRSVESFSLPGKPHGCLVALGATNCAPANKGPQEYLLAIRRRTPRLIKERLDRAVAEGELPADLDTGSVAAFYTTVVHGLGIRAADGASRAHLTAAVDGAMAAWSGLTLTGGKGRRAARKRRAADG
jgi:AcrR family transcriptional regulator